MTRREATPNVSEVRPGFYQRLPYTGIAARQRPPGTMRSVVEVFLASTKPDLPAHFEDMSAGRYPVPPRPELPRHIEKLIADRDHLRSILATEEHPDPDVAERLVAVTEELGEAIVVQAAEGRRALSATREERSPEWARAAFIRDVRSGVLDAVRAVTDEVDAIQLALREPPLNRTEREQMAAIALRLRRVAGTANSELKQFLKGEAGALREKELRHVKEAREWLAQATHPLATVPMYVDYLNASGRSGAIEIPGVVQEVLFAERGDYDRRESRLSPEEMAARAHRSLLGHKVTRPMMMSTTDAAVLRILRRAGAFGEGALDRHMLAGAWLDALVEAGILVGPTNAATQAKAILALEEVLEEAGVVGRDDPDMPERLTDENAFEALAMGIRGMMRGWDKLAAATTVVEEMAPNPPPRIPRCCADLW